MKPVQLRSYAKINLTLDVLGRDEQAGKHFLNTIFYRLEQPTDTVVLEKRSDQQNVIHCDYPGVSKGKLNTVHKALDLLGETGWEVTIKKQIPVQAGLGGGSGNAGAVLKYFGEQRGIPTDHLMELARQIGADVPFFVLNENLAYAEGFGDQIVQSWTIPSLDIVIMPTGLARSTPEAYAALDLDECGSEAVKTDALVQQLNEGATISEGMLKPFVHNDFESSFFDAFPSARGEGNLCGSGGAMWRFGT